jgi:hypothetical protein
MFPIGSVGEIEFEKSPCVLLDKTPIRVFSLAGSLNNQLISRAAARYRMGRPVPNSQTLGMGVIQIELQHVDGGVLAPVPKGDF